MKKLMLIIIGSLLGFNSFSQNIEIKPTGFGFIQLGMPISNFSYLLTSRKIDNENDYINIVYHNYTVESFQLIADTTQTYCTFGSYDKRVKVFYIGEMNATNLIKLKGVELSFFNDTLYSIKIDKCINDILTLKYGEPKIDIKEKDHTFQNGYDATFIKTDRETDYYWKTTNNTHLYCYTNYYYSNNGELEHFEYTEIYYRKIWKKVFDETQLVENRIEQLEKNKNNNNIKGF